MERYGCDNNYEATSDTCTLSTKTRRLKNKEARGQQSTQRSRALPGIPLGLPQLLFRPSFVLYNVSSRSEDDIKIPRKSLKKMRLESCSSTSRSAQDEKTSRLTPLCLTALDIHSTKKQPPTLSPSLTALSSRLSSQLLKRQGPHSSSAHARERVHLKVI